MKIKELISNADGRLSTTATIQFLGFLVLAVILLISVLLARDSAEAFYNTFAIYCGGLTVSKGAVGAYKASQESKGGGDA